MSAFDLLPLFLPAAMVGSAIGAQSMAACALPASGGLACPGLSVTASKET